MLCFSHGMSVWKFLQTYFVLNFDMDHLVLKIKDPAVSQENEGVLINYFADSCPLISLASLDCLLFIG